MTATAFLLLPRLLPASFPLALDAQLLREHSLRGEAGEEAADPLLLAPAAWPAPSATAAPPLELPRGPASVSACWPAASKMARAAASFGVRPSRIRAAKRSCTSDLKSCCFAGALGSWLSWAPLSESLAAECSDTQTASANDVLRAGAGASSALPRPARRRSSAAASMSRTLPRPGGTFDSLAEGVLPLPLPCITPFDIDPLRSNSRIFWRAAL
mmetsp:Transcript_74529/g.197974  ORF Transcript_74529/g.197974 Transcript_74529/m.197974 type:complete len:214 (-) Transcript_74529:273-914(-)